MDQEHKKEIQALKDKLDQNKVYIRKLEDENLNLKYQLYASRKREDEQQATINELKQLLRKYYKKAQDLEREKLNSSICLPSLSILKESNSFISEPVKEIKRSNTCFDGSGNRNLLTEDGTHYSPPLSSNEPSSIRISTDHDRARTSADESPLFIPQQKKFSSELTNEKSFELDNNGAQELNLFAKRREEIKNNDHQLTNGEPFLSFRRNSKGEPHGSRNTILNDPECKTIKEKSHII